MLAREVGILDLRPAIHDIVQTDRTIRAVLHHTEPPFRPSGLPEPTLITRVAQGQPDEGALREALSGDLVLTAPPPGAVQSRKRAS